MCWYSLFVTSEEGDRKRRTITNNDEEIWDKIACQPRKIRNMNEKIGKKKTRVKNQTTDENVHRKHG
jgi:hypothetical protein